MLQDAKLKFPSFIVEEPLPRGITIEVKKDEQGNIVQVERYDVDAEIYLTEYADIIRLKEPFAS